MLCRAASDVIFSAKVTAGFNQPFDGRALIVYGDKAKASKGQGSRAHPHILWTRQEGLVPTSCVVAGYAPGTKLLAVPVITALASRGGPKRPEHVRQGLRTVQVMPFIDRTAPVARLLDQVAQLFGSSLTSTSLPAMISAKFPPNDATVVVESR